MHVQLTIVGGKANKGEVRIRVPSVIGRSRQAGLTIAHPTISRRHCELYELEGQLYVRDLGSLNGVFVAGRRVTDAPLPPNAEFRIGPLTFRVQYPLARQSSGSGTAQEIPAAIGPVEPDFDVQPPTPEGEPLPGLFDQQPALQVRQPAEEDRHGPEAEAAPSPGIPDDAGPDEPDEHDPSEAARAGAMPSLFPDFAPEEGAQVVFSPPPEQRPSEASPAWPSAAPEAEVPELLPGRADQAEGGDHPGQPAGAADAPAQEDAAPAEKAQPQQPGQPKPSPGESAADPPQEHVLEFEDEKFDDFLRRLGQ